jgi:hypothetical protein
VAKPLRVERLFSFSAPTSDGPTWEDAMNTFRKATQARSVMFLVSYDDARTAYLWVDDLGKASDLRAVGLIARAQQEQGTLPEGRIASIRRIR